MAINELTPEQYQGVLHYFNYDPLAVDVWLEKYALKDNKGILKEKSFIDTISRIVDTLSSYIPRKRGKLQELFPFSMNTLRSYMENKLFMFGGSVLFGLGNPYVRSSLANCFVIGNTEDSYGGIFNTDEEQVQLMKRRGGVGHDISHLRPKGSRVDNAALSSTGAVSFMHRFSNSTREVAQDGRRKRSGL